MPLEVGSKLSSLSLLIPDELPSAIQCDEDEDADEDDVDDDNDGCGDNCDDLRSGSVCCQLSFNTVRPMQRRLIAGALGGD